VVSEVGRIIPRSDWAHRTPRTLSRSINPSHGVVGHHGGDARLWPYTRDRAFTLVRGWQNFHMDSRGWSDLAYNAVVDLYGRVFVARGPGVRSAANGTDLENGRRYAICFLMGGDDPLTDEAKFGFLAARQFLRSQDLRTGHIIVGHQNVRATSCPGTSRQQWINAGAPAPKVVTQAPPSTAPIDTHTVEDDDVRTALIEVPIGGDGNGWRAWNPGLNRAPRPVAVSLHGPHPPSDGYWYTGADGKPTVAMQARGNEVIVSVTGARPGGITRVFASAG
jgi:hypothetical protein